MRIALAGNPNSGKTTMFNNLTGSSQYVGNWPGVTVEKKEGRLRGAKDVLVVDLPGIYSLSPYTLEEVVSRKFLLQEKPDAIVNIVDASNIERNLYLTTQLLEIGTPVVLVLNMMDLVRKNGDRIDVKGLSGALGCPVIEATALKGEGSLEAAHKAAELAASGASRSAGAVFDARVEGYIRQVSDVIGPYVPGNLRYYAIKLFERDKEIESELAAIPEQARGQIEQIVAAAEKEMDDDAESIVTAARYDYIAALLSVHLRKSTKGLSASDKIDRVLTNRVLALPIFAVVMYAVYALAMMGPGLMLTDWVNDVLFGSVIPNAVSGFLESVNCAAWLQGLVMDGIVGGVGAVLGFVPQILVLFFALSILEDCGYMARVAFIMDRIFRKFGLSGKSFIPMLISTGCGVPGIMATRTIENEKDRRMTIMLTTFIPCSAKLPIFALFAGALFGGSPNVAFSMYAIGLVSIITCGILLKRTKKYGGDPAPFVMELPAYHVPSLKGVLIHMWERGKTFIQKAGTVILLTTVLIWLLGSFSFGLRMVPIEESILAGIGRVLAPLFIPLGWGNWQSSVAAVSGLIAKENIVGTFGVLYGMQDLSDTGSELWGSVAAIFNGVTAYSFMIFNLLCCPCFAAVGTIRRELGSWKRTLATVGFQCLVAYIAAFLVYIVGSLFIGF